MNNYLNYFIAIVIFSSCNSSQNENLELSKSTPTTIYKIDGSFANIFSWNDKVDVEQIIPLETSSKSLIVDINKVIINNNNIYILDTRNYNLIVFDQNGKFIQKIGTIGKGPGEYIEIRDFDISNGFIYTLDYRKIHKYNLNDGKFIETIDLVLDKNDGLNPTNIIAFNDDHYYLWNGNPDVYKPKEKTYFQLFEYKHDKIVSNYFAYKYKIMDGNRFNKRASGGYFMLPQDGEYCIYKIDDDNIQNDFKLDFGKDSIPSEFFNKKHGSEYFNIYLKSKYYKMINQIHELPKNKLYFSCIGPGSYNYEGLIDRKTEEVYFGKRDIKFSPKIMFSDNKYIYGFYKPHQIVNNLNQGNSKNQIFEFLKKNVGKIQDTDNFILVKLSIK